MFFDIGRIFFGPWGTEKVEDLPMIFLDLAVIILVDLDVFALFLKVVVWTRTVFVFGTGFFLGPVHLLRGPWFHSGGGGTPCYMRSNWAGCFLDLGTSFFDLFMFCGHCARWGNLDMQTRCMQEVVDAGEIRILKQQKCKKWRRGRGMKTTCEATWMQEVERHMGEGKVRYWNKMIKISC